MEIDPDDLRNLRIRRWSIRSDPIDRPLDACDAELCRPHGPEGTEREGCARQSVTVVDGVHLCAFHARRTRAGIPVYSLSLQRYVRQRDA